MGKKPGEKGRDRKGREWEKERRDKLNAGFHGLCKLLPDHDPSINMSKMEILRKATEYIKHLQEKNEEIIKCGNENFLKSETERLKKRVAYLILKTTELVDALRQAGVPIPSKSKKKNTKAKSKVGSSSLNQQNSDPSLTNKVEDNSKTGKTTNKKKLVKCGCEKKLQLNKKPLTEVNPLVSVNETSVSCAVTASLSNSVSEVCNSVSQSTSAGSNCTPSSTDKSAPQIITHNVPPNLVAQITTSGIVTQSVVHPLIQTTVSVLKPTQTLSVDKKELSKLGPGTLIFADGRIVNVPPVIPQIVVKPPPPAPPPAVILMQTPEIALQKPIVKLTSTDEKKEKFIVPKKREITMTTFVNKVPIPAVKAFRLESCSREPRTKKKANKEQKKNQSADNTSTATTSSSTSSIVSNTTTSTTSVTSTETALTKRKRQDEPNTVNKSQKNNAKTVSANDQGETIPSENNSGKDEKSQSVKHSIDDIFSKQNGNDVECLNVTSEEASSKTTDYNPVKQSEKMTDVSTVSVSSLNPPSQAMVVTSIPAISTTDGDMIKKKSEVVESLQTSILTEECTVPTTSVTASLPMNTVASTNTVTQIVDSPVPAEPKTTCGISVNMPAKPVTCGTDCSNVITSINTRSLSSVSLTTVAESVESVNHTPLTSASTMLITSDSLTTKDLPKNIESSCNKINEVSSNASVVTSANCTISSSGDIFNKTSSKHSTPNIDIFSSALSSVTSTTYADSFACSSFIPSKMDVPNAFIPPKVNEPAVVSMPVMSETIVNKNMHTTGAVCTPSRVVNVAVTSTSTKISDNSISGRYVNTKTNELISTSNCSNLSSLNMTTTSSVFSMSQGYSAPFVSNNSTKNSGVYVMPDMFSNNTHVPSKSVANFSVDYSYNNTANLGRTLPSYTAADVFVNPNPLGHLGQTSSTIGLNENNMNTISTSVTSTSFRMPTVSVCNANALTKTFVSSSYSMADVFVTNIHLTQKNPSTFSNSVTDSCCIPPIVPKHTSSCCLNGGADSLNMITAKSTTTFTKNNLFPSIATSTYKTSGTFGAADIGINSTSVRAKPTTAFSMPDMFNHNVATTTKMSSFNMPDVYTTYNTPLCSSKTSSVFGVPDSFTTNGTLAKTSHTFTMSDLYSSNPVTCKSSLPFTMSGITSSVQNSTVAFTMSNISNDRPNKPCEQIPTTISSAQHNTPLYDAQHKNPPGPVITSSKQYSAGEKDKTYPVSAIGNNFKNDQCNDFLRSTKDIDRSFMPVMDDVRLTSDFSNDLFSSLQVPTGGHHSESISPTAAFLLAFPLVSTSKNTENLTDTENHDNHHTSTPTTILQIGNIEPPSTELFHSVDFAKNKDFEVQTDLDYKSKQKQKHKNPPNFNQSSYSSYPVFPNDYNHQCDVNWSKPIEKKKPEKIQKYQYDCYKQDKKKRKISVNWMTTPENDMYREAEFPSSSGQYNIEMETFPDLCNSKKNQGNYSWSPSKSLLPLDNPLMIPSTLPTLVGDLALGTTTPSDPFKRCDKKEKQEEKKFVQPKSQTANFLSVSQLVDPKSKKQKPSTDRQYNKQKQITPTSGTDKKRQCMGPSTNHQRDFQTTSKRKESNDPSCMYPDNFVPNFNWDNKHRYKGGSYSAESLIQQDVCDTSFNFNYQQNNFFQNSEFGHDAGQSGCGQYQNFLNISQGHFSSCVSEEYPTDNFTLTGQSNNRMGAPPIGQSVLPASNEKQRNISHPLKDLHLRDESGYHCGSGSTATFHHYPPHHHHHQQHQQQQHPAGYSTTNLQHNFSSVGGSGTGPPVPPPPPLPPPVSNYSVTTTSTLANFNLSTIFPEMNDQRVGTASGAPPRNHLNTFSNNQTCRGHVSMH